MKKFVLELLGHFSSFERSRDRSVRGVGFIGFLGFFFFIFEASLGHLLAQDGVKKLTEIIPDKIS